MWRDRVEAGRALAEELVRSGYGERGGVLVLGIPRGGVEVARQVADRLAAPLDVVVVRKIGAPGAPEYAAGAVDIDGEVLVNAEAGVSRAWIDRAAVPERAEALRREAVYRAGRAPVDPSGRTVILVDDGIATGLTAIAALRWLARRGAAHRVIAAPVMPPEAVRMLASEADDVVALETPREFMAVGSFYAHFPQLTDAEVVSLLAQA